MQTLTGGAEARDLRGMSGLTKPLEGEITDILVAPCRQTANSFYRVFLTH